MSLLESKKISGAAHLLTCAQRYTIDYRGIYYRLHFSTRNIKLSLLKTRSKLHSKFWLIKDDKRRQSEYTPVDEKYYAKKTHKHDEAEYPTDCPGS